MTVCSKYITVNGPIKKLRIIHGFELYKYELDKFDCIMFYYILDVKSFLQPEIVPHNKH